MIKNLRRFISKIKPNFTEGGKFAWLQSTFEAFESFLFVPDETTKRGCQIRDAIDLKRTMIFVVIGILAISILKPPQKPSVFGKPSVSACSKPCPSSLFPTSRAWPSSSPSRKSGTTKSMRAFWSLEC